MITIVDYNTGNLRSISNMLRFLGVDSQISNDPIEVARATKIILPGVGHFDFGMANLNQSGLVDILKTQAVVNKTPVLGICLGAQLLTRKSAEGDLPGLGWIHGETVGFDRQRLPSNLRIPHMGWSETEVNINNPLFKGVAELPRYYYVHSFHMVCDRPEDELCHTVHGYRFVSGICHGNIYGVQFHPEKSHRFGMTVLKNFAENC